MEQLEQKQDLPIATRLQEYSIILEHIASLGTRRQNTDNIFIALNTIFLSAIGLLLISSHLNSWWTVIIAGFVSLLITPINTFWFTTARRHTEISNYYFDYLREIEKEYKVYLQKYLPEAEVGVFLGFKNRFNINKYGMVDTQNQLAIYILVLYPLIMVLLAIITYFVKTGFVPTLNL